MVRNEILSRTAILENGCVEWTGGRFSSGYGRVWVDGKGRRAHRVIYELFNGPIPEGLAPDHRCHTNDLSCAGGPACPHRRCVNVDHLDLITTRENILRGRGRAAVNATKQTCNNGHRLTTANTGPRADAANGGRRCRSCAVEATQRYYARKGRA